MKGRGRGDGKRTWQRRSRRHGTEEHEVIGTKIEEETKQGRRVDWGKHNGPNSQKKYLYLRVGVPGLDATFLHHALTPCKFSKCPSNPAPVPPCTTPSFSTTTLPSGAACAWFALDLTDRDDLFDLDEDDVVRTLALLLEVVLAAVTALHTDPALFFCMLPSIVGC